MFVLVNLEMSSFNYYRCQLSANWILEVPMRQGTLSARGNMADLFECCLKVTVTAQKVTGEQVGEILLGYICFPSCPGV